MSEVWKSVFNLRDTVRRLCSAWLFCSCVLLITQKEFTNISFAQNTSILLILVGIVALFSVFTAARYFFHLKYLENWTLLISAVLYAWLLIRGYSGSRPYSFCAVVLLALVLLLFPLFKQKDWALCPIAVDRRLCIAAVCVCGLFFVAVIGTITCLRYASFGAPNYDFGIFANMFHHMKTTFLPNVSCERDMLLSHFAVHISPIYYVLLPFYVLFPSPYTLQIGQAVVLASGLIPLYLLAKKYALSNKIIVVLSMLYALYPALSGGCFYDIHENCFLTPLLLWVFVCYEYGRMRWLFVAAFSVLMVKEDAAVYIVFFAIYILITHKDWLRGILLFSMAISYFGIAVLLLTNFGDGAMLDRYANLMYEDTGLVGVVFTLIRNPGYFLDQLFKTSNGGIDKWKYLFQLLIPLGVLPFVSKKGSRFLLLAPLLLNLLTLYVYQYDIGFQYSFGISAFLIYATLLNVSDLTPLFRRGILSYAAMAACLMFSILVLPRLDSQVKNYRNNRETYRQMEEILDTVPEDATVTASCMLVPHLAQRDVTYELAYHKQADTDYLVLDIRPGYSAETQKQAQFFRDAGYVTTEVHENMIEILQKSA